MALDVASQQMYFAGLGAGAIQVANMDGSGTVQSVVPVGTAGGGVAVDAADGKIYWTNGDAIQLANGGLSGEIQRANLDGSNPQTLVTGLVHPGGFAIDTLDGKVYWTELGGPANSLEKLQSSNLDGSNVQTILTGLGQAYGLAVDAPDGKLFWTDTTTHSIESANLDGSGLHAVVMGLENPTTLALDLSAGKIYWTSSESQQASYVASANLDGSDIQTLVSGVGEPWGIAVVPEPSAFALGVLGALSLLVLRCGISQKHSAA
jgi:DNA-binding beta-propeller fold protein YncE